MTCSHTTSCELYVQFAADPSIQLWKTHYCDSDYKRCARYALSVQGKAVPLTLLPNGKQIQTAMSDEDRGLHALFNAIQKNRLSMVKAFMKTKVTNNKVANNDGVTPVMYAASLGRAEIMRFMLDSGCNPHHRSRKGQNALELAAASGHQECVDILRDFMDRVPPPSAGERLEVADNMETAVPRGALMGRILGFLRGHKPETV
ncbi:MAG: ankyrin repeat domain-containing protein [Gammaproteobacteria bacterium]|jgi:ankyrin repeat protein